MADYDLGTARGRIEIDASQAAAGVGQATKATDDFNLRQRAAAQTLTQTGTALLGAGTLIAGGFALAVNSAADFEQRISAIKAVSGATGPELDQVRAKALQLGADTKYSAGEAASAMEELIKAGLSVPDVLNGAADATVNLAAAGEIDLPAAATIAANAMNQFGLTAQEMPHVADLIAGAANASAIDVGQFGMSMQQAGAMAHLSGVSFDDLTTTIAAMGNAGIVGSDAGTSLKTMLQNLQPTTARQKEAMMDLGLWTKETGSAFYDANGKIKPMADIAELLKSSLSNLTEEQKSLALSTIFGSDAIRAAAVIADNGKEGFDSLAASIGKVSAQDVAQQRMDNLKGSMEQLKGSVETLLIVVGKPLADALRGWVDMFTQVINKITELDPSILNIGLKIAGVVAAILLGAGAFLLVTGWVKKLELAFDALKIVLLENPFILIVLALVALGIAFYQAYQNIQPFHDLVDRVIANLKENLLPIIQQVKYGVAAFWSAFNGEGITSDGFVGAMERAGVAVREFWDDLKLFWTALTTGFTENEGETWFEDLALSIHSAWEGISNFVDAIGGWQTVIIGLGIAIAAIVAPIPTLVAAIIYAYNNFETFHDVVDDIIAGLQDTYYWINNYIYPVFFSLGELVAAVVERIIQVWTTMWPFIKVVLGIITDGIQNFITFVSTLWDAFGDHILNFIVLIFDQIRGTVEGALEIIQGIIDTVTALIKGDWSGVWQGIQEIFKGVWDFIRQFPETVLNELKELIPTLVDVIKGLWKAGWDLVRDEITQVWGVIQDTVKTILGDIKDFIEDRVGNIRDFWVGVFDAIKQKVVDIFTAIKDFITDKLGAVKDFITDTLGAIKDFIGDQLGNIKSAWSDAWDAVSTKVHDVWEGIKTTISDALGTVVGWIQGLKDQITSAAAGAFDGLIDAAKGAANGIITFFNRMIDVVNGVQFHIHIHDPIPGLPNIDFDWNGVNLPHIPTLDIGGLITNPTLAALSMNSVPEIVSPVPMLEAMFERYSGPTPAGGDGGLRGLRIDHFEQKIEGVPPELVSRETYLALQQLATEWEFSS